MEKTEIIQPRSNQSRRGTRRKTVIELTPTAPFRRKPPQRKPRREIEIKAPVPLNPVNISKKIDEHIIDNSRSSAAKPRAEASVKHSRFLLTFVPNSSVREEINPELYSSLKKEITSFAQYIMDERNLSDILKPAPGNTDPKWFSKVIRLGKDKVAAIEDSRDSNKRLHTHIYLPIEHKTRIMLDLDNIRKIAAIMLEPLGITGPRIDAKVQKTEQQYNARDYVMKMGDGKTIIN